MSVTDSGGSLRITTPMAPVLRGFLIVVGLFVITISVWELHRGVWPLNYGSPFFAFIILGAMSVGGPAILGGLFGWSTSWIVASGRIRIAQRNPFRTRHHRLTEADIVRFDIVEHQAMEGDNTFSVAVVTQSGERFETHDVATLQKAEMLRDRIVMVFRR